MPQNTENTLGVTFLLYAIGFFLFASAFYVFQKDKIYRVPSNGWLSVKKYPIPEDIRYFLATDGKKVEYVITPFWGAHGKAFFSSYDKKEITHWQPFPDLPKGD